MSMNIRDIHVSKKKKSIQSAFAYLENEIDMQTFQETVILFLKKFLIHGLRIILIILCLNS